MTVLGSKENSNTNILYIYIYIYIYISPISSGYEGIHNMIISLIIYLNYYNDFLNLKLQ